MATGADPYRTLGLDRGASLAEVKRAYRRLAKANHPDAAGEAALPRFLAIQAAYDLIAGPDDRVRRGAAGGGSTPRRPWEADPARAGATHRAYAGRTRRARPEQGPGPEPGPRPRPGPRPETGTPRPGGSAGSERERPPDRPPKVATLGSTSYDGVDAEAPEPDWGGASWYGTTSGTYWTLNPKEYADPRKHGPEYQARARRRRAGGETASSTDPPGETLAPDPADPVADGSGGAAPPAPRTHTPASWWEAMPSGAPGSGTSSAATDPRPVDEDPAPDRRRPADDSTASGPPRSRAALGASADLATDAVVASMRAWLDDDRPPLGARIGRAVIGWAPVALGIGWIAGEVTGCSRFSADCDAAVAPVSWGVQLAALALLGLLPRVARVATVATIATLAAVVPGAVLLLATSDPGAVEVGRTALGGLMAIAWCAGLAYGLLREGRRVGRRDRGVGPGTGRGREGGRERRRAASDPATAPPTAGPGGPVS